MVGGMERVFINYANLFIKRGYDVTVYNLTNDDEAIIKELDRSLKYYKNFMPVKHLLKAHIKDIFRLRFRILPITLWWKYHSAKYLYKKYITEEFDVEIAFFGIETIKIISGSTNKNACKIGWIHSSNCKQFFGFVKNSEIDKIYKNIQKIICVSIESKELIENKFGRFENLFVVNNPSNCEKIKTLSLEYLNIKKKKFTFINVSRIDDKSKGFLRLLSVCKRLNDENFVFDFWIVGDGLDREKVEAKVKEFRLKNIVLFGQQNNPYKYMVKADMYLCGSYYEGFSMTMSEAIILAKPILTTVVSGVSEMLGDGKYGFIVENSEEGLYQGMRRILTDRNLFEHYCQMADLRKDYLSEEKIMDKIEKIIREN